MRYKSKLALILLLKYYFISYQYYNLNIDMFDLYSCLFKPRKHKTQIQLAIQMNSFYIHNKHRMIAQYD